MMRHPSARRHGLAGLVLAITGLFLIGSVLSAAAPNESRGPRGAGQAEFEDKLDGLPSDLLQAFKQGDDAFGKAFVVSDGLGPVFNNDACETCHPGNGRGTVSTNFILFGRYDGELFDFMTALGGPQFQDKSIPGAPQKAIPPDATVRSERNPPPVFGMGFIEAIPEAAILARVDPDDADGDGISGRANFVAGAFEGAAPHRFLGRFGRKAGTATLLEQTARAYVKDMGLTNPFFSKEVPQPGGLNVDVIPDPEVDAGTVLDAAMYVRLLKPPPTGPVTPMVQTGERLFEAVGCANCHTPVMRTGSHRITALSNQEARLYSDLLLHDMGPELADNYPDGMATGQEWRTTPLWGVALSGPPFLHDGRATTLTDAIRAHGGEAQAARERFMSLRPEEATALLAFLESL